MAAEKSTASIADFEKSLDELEKLVNDLERGELSLEQSLTAHPAHCRYGPDL